LSGAGDRPSIGRRIALRPRTETFSGQHVGYGEDPLLDRGLVQHHARPHTIRIVDVGLVAALKCAARAAIVMPAWHR
jgi:hypothetical protein